MTTYTNQPDGTDGIDASMFGNDPTTNYGTRVYLDAGHLAAGGVIYRSLWKNDFTKGTNPPPANATVLSATLSLYIGTADDSSTDRTLRVYRVKRAWTEAGVTYNKYDGTNDWGTAGCADTTNDREATDIGSVSVTNGAAAGTEFQIALTPSAVQAWLDGTFTNNGLLLKMDTESGDLFYFGSSDNATAGYRPKLVLEWTLATRRTLALLGVA